MTLSFDAAIASQIIATNQTAQFRDWIATMAALGDLTAGNDGAEQVSRICRATIRRDFHATERQWARLQSAYWVSTDGYGRLNPARLALIVAY